MNYYPTVRLRHHQYSNNFCHEFGGRHGPFWPPLHRRCIYVELGVKMGAL